MLLCSAVFMNLAAKAHWVDIILHRAKGIVRHSIHMNVPLSNRRLGNIRTHKS